MDQLTFTKTIKTDGGEELMLTRVTDDAADANTLRTQGWTEAKPAETEEATRRRRPHRPPAPSATTDRPNKENTNGR